MIAIGLGGNVGTDAEIVARFRRARTALGATRSSRLYRSSPIGPAQRDYLNAAVLMPDTGSPPDRLIASVLAVEEVLGRDRRGEARWGPRTIDLDVLAWEDPAVEDKAFAWWPGKKLWSMTLEVPHPRVQDRRFALEPMADLLGAPWRAMADVVADQRVEVVADVW